MADIYEHTAGKKERKREPSEHLVEGADSIIMKPTLQCTPDELLFYPTDIGIMPYTVTGIRFRITVILLGFKFTFIRILCLSFRHKSKCYARFLVKTSQAQDIYVYPIEIPADQIEIYFRKWVAFIKYFKEK